MTYLKVKWINATAINRCLSIVSGITNVGSVARSKSFAMEGWDVPIPTSSSGRLV
jgi:hypothetical protein